MVLGQHNEFGCLFDTVYKNQLKWIVALNARTKTIKFLKENTGIDLCNFGLGNGCLDVAPKVQTARKTMYIRLHQDENFGASKDSLKKVQKKVKNPQNGTKYLQITYLRRDLQNIKNSYNSMIKVK